jgi:3-phenylpropionate/trans-cinnamate dioxygenase ferredoxin reductase subunit
VFPGSGPLSNILGEDVGSRMTQIHREHGVELIPGDRLEMFRGDGRVEEAVTTSGRRIECSMAILGLGVEPNVEFLEGSGVSMNDGVLVDAACRTNVAGIFAAGDVARHDHPIFGSIRVEHYNNAEKQGRHVARSMLGEVRPYDYVHTFWSDQYEHKLEYVGFARDWDRFVVSGDAADGAFLGFYLKDAVLQAAMGLDRGGDPEAEPDSELAACAKLVGARVDPAALEDSPIRAMVDAARDQVP